jgi:flavoprotein
VEEEVMEVQEVVTVNLVADIRVRVADTLVTRVVNVRVAPLIHWIPQVTAILV